MQLRNRTTLEVKVGDRTYSMDCNSDSPLGEVYDALTQMRSYIVERITTQSDNEKKAEEECPKSAP